MRSCNKLEKLDALILCGGKGTRLRSIVNDRPKPMAEFGKQPFLSILMSYVASWGIRRFILCTGYLKEMVKEYYNKRPLPWKVLYSEETKAQGTGGAVRNAKRLIESSPFLVMNGDSFCKFDLEEFLNFHLKNKALVSMVVVRGNNNPHCGKVTLDVNMRVIGFKEKVKQKSRHYCSAGVYLMNKEIFRLMGEKRRFSLEYDLFPAITGKRCYGFRQDSDLIDYGTPGGYRRAKRLGFLSGAKNI